MNRFEPRPAGTQSTGTQAAVARARLRAAVLALAALSAVAVAAGCTAPAAPAPAPSGTAATTPAPTAPTSAASASPPNCGDVYASSLKPLPGPLQLPPGSFMAKIKARGHLIAGVDANTYNFEYFNPRYQTFEGFDIEMIRAVAQAIFGNPNAVQYKAITNAERATDVNNGTVDIVAHTYTINCDHLKQVAFSTVYYDAHRRVLVLGNSYPNGLSDLGGQKVCATTGSDAITSIESAPSHPTLVTEPHITDCLVLLQQGQAAAICSDDSILESLVRQDPYTKIVGPVLMDEPYGLAIKSTNTDFIRFVNAVLQNERTSGAWKASYAKWVAEPGATIPDPPRVGYAD